jgi:hypothetical protein
MTFGGGDEPNIVARIIADATDFAKGVNDAVDAAVDKIAQLSVAATNSTAGLKDAMDMIDAMAAQTGQTWQEVAAQLTANGTLTQTMATQAVQALQKIQTQASSLSNTMTSLNTTIATTIKGLLGISAIRIAREIIQFLQDASAAAMRFNFENYRLEVAVRAVGRRMGESAGTMKEWTGFIQELRKQFNIFSTVDLTTAVSKVMLLTRELGFTKDQMKEVAKASIALAEISGKDVEEAARRLALFLDTGYSRGLAQLGVQISKMTVEQYAMANGFNKTYNEMTRGERATWALKAVMQQVAPIMDDAGKAAMTFQGRMMALQAAQSDLMIKLGTPLASFTIAWEQVKTTMLDWAVRVIPIVIDSMNGWFIAVGGVTGGIAGAFGALFNYLHNVVAKGLVATFRELGNSTAYVLENMTQGAIKGMAQADEYFKSNIRNAGQLGDVAQSELGMFSDAIAGVSKTQAETQADIERGLKDINAEMMRYAIDQENNDRDHQNKLTDIETAGQNDRLDAYRKYQIDMREMDIKYQFDYNKLIENAVQDEVNNQTEAKNKISDKIAEHNLKDLQAQREFNLQMEQLNREYLFNLEDAVRERDARAILQLQRKHNLDVTKKTEDYDEQRRQRDEQLALDLAQMARDDRQKAVQRRNQLNQQIRDLNAQYAFDRARQQRQYNDELTQLAIQLQRRREAEALDYDRRKLQLEREHNDRLQAIGAFLAEAVNMEQGAADDLYNNLVKIFGPGGLTDQLYQGMMRRILQYRDQMSQMESGYRQLNQAGQLGVAGAGSVAQPYYSSGEPKSYRMYGGWASGGAFVAKQPGQATIAEKEPELAAFIPLSRLNEVFGGMGAGGGKNTPRVALDITVKPDRLLSVEIEDNIMHTMADVLTSLRKEKPAR